MLFNEPKLLKFAHGVDRIPVVESFSALQRAEIAEILRMRSIDGERFRFSALQRAEIAEIPLAIAVARATYMFQCSSTSRNC